MWIDPMPEQVYVDVYDTQSRRITRIYIEGPLADWIGARCAAVIGEVIEEARLTTAGAQGVGFVPRQYEEIYSECFNRRHYVEQVFPRGWVIEANRELTEAYAAYQETQAIEQPEPKPEPEQS